jgi:predicted esterase
MGNQARPAHYVEHKDLEYGTARLGGEDVQLRLDLTLPRDPVGLVPLAVWIHGGGFHHGDKDWAGHRTDARWLTRAGYAYASINYRLNAKEADLSPEIRARLRELQRHRDPAFRTNLSGAASLAALEDALTAVNWLWQRRDTYGFSDWLALGGNSAGAITALNVVHLSGFFGLSRPPVRAIVSISGGFAYPALYAPALVPVHALHNPSDPRVKVPFIRKVAGIGGDHVTLIEAGEQDHGRIRLRPDEPVRDAYGRIIGFLDGVRTATA